MLEPMERPQAAFAQQVISTALREAYLRFALHAAWLSLGDVLVLASVRPERCPALIHPSDPRARTR